MNKRLLIIIIFLVTFFGRNMIVNALDENYFDLYLYSDYPVVGDTPSNKADVKILFHGGTSFTHTVDAYWVECDFTNTCENDTPVSVFRDGFVYKLFWDYSTIEEKYDGQYLDNEYFNDMDYYDGKTYIPLPSKKYDNISNGLVKITDISLDSKSTTAVIDETPSFKDLDVSFGFGFTNVDDYVKYKVSVQNNDNDDYMLKSNEMFSDSGYVKYELDFDDGSDIIKSNSDKTFYITVKYVKEVPDEELTEGVYTESNNTKLVFTNNDIVNPSTSNKIIFVLSIFIILIIGLLLVKFNNKEIKYTMMIIMGILMFIPVSISALKEINIGVEADIKVRRVKEFCVQDIYRGCGGYYYTLERHVYNYYPGMKVYELSLDYRNINDDDYFNNFRYELNFTNDYSSTGIDNASVYGPTDLILDSSQGCYIGTVTSAIC